MRVLVAMLGARRRYIVPAVMEELGVLAYFVTDVFVGKRRLLPAILRLVGRVLNINGLRSLADRSSARIPIDRTVAFHWLGMRYAIDRRFSNVDAGLFASVNRRFCLRAIPYLNAVDICWAYNGAAQELFEAARAANIRCVLEQVIAPRNDERREINLAAQNWPDWRTSVEQPTAVALDSLSLREQEEWRLADVIVAGSHYVKDCLERAGVSKNRCVVVPSGIDLEQFRVGNEARNTGSLRVLFVGHVNLRKGAPYLLEAVRRLNSSHLEVKLIGSIQARQESIREFAQWATFSGPVPASDIVSHYHWADILVVPSVCEGSAMVTYEARSCGVPIVATPNAGAAFSPGVDGLEIPVRDSDAIAAVLDRLARNRGELRRLREGAIANRHALGRDAYRERIRRVLETVTGTVSTHAGSDPMATAAVRV